MKIALFCSARNTIPPYKTGGTEQPIYYLAKELARQGHQVVLYAGRGSKVTGVEVRELAPIAFGRRRKYLFEQENIAEFFDLAALTKLFKEEAMSFDIIQFNNYKFFEIIPFSEWTKTPVLIRINFPFKTIYTYLKTGLKKYKNVHYLPISNFVKSLMPDLGYTDAIYPAIDLEDFPYSNKPKDYLLFIGRICHNKGVHLAIEAAKKAKKKLIIAGPVNEDEPDIDYFNDLIKPQINNKNIIYVGEVDFSRKIKLYQGALATLFPTNWSEPFGNVQIESMACGTPVITFDRAAAREAVADKISGYIIKKGDTSAMAKAVKQVDKINRKKVRNWAENNFSIKKVVKQYEKIYKDLIG